MKDLNVKRELSFSNNSRNTPQRALCRACFANLSSRFHVRVSRGQVKAVGFQKRDGV